MKEALARIRKKFLLLALFFAFGGLFIFFCNMISVLERPVNHNAEGMGQKKNLEKP